MALCDKCEQPKVDSGLRRCFCVVKETVHPASSTDPVYITEEEWWKLPCGIFVSGRTHLYRLYTPKPLSAWGHRLATCIKVKKDCNLFPIPGEECQLGSPDYIMAEAGTSAWKLGDHIS